MWLHKYLLTTHSNEVKHWALPFIECPMWNFKLISANCFPSRMYWWLALTRCSSKERTKNSWSLVIRQRWQTIYSSGSDPLSSLEAQPQTWPLDTFNCQRSDSISKLSQDSWFFWLTRAESELFWPPACHPSFVRLSIFLTVCELFIFSSSSLEPLGWFQPISVQSIIGLREFMSV